MLKTSLKVLKKIEEKGFKAYIVGGFVRDYLLGNESYDVDITTDATPKDIKQIFKDIHIPKEVYGAVTLHVKNIRYEITTFRKELTYIQNRKPIEIEYVKDLYLDLIRRDFTINTICMDSKGNIIDLLNGQNDLVSRELNTVGNSENKFKEDALRILRAVRFATVLNFRLSEEVKAAIVKTKKYLKNVSYNRKKEELDKIFANLNAQYGIKLLLELGLDKELGIYNLRNIKVTNDILGTWSTLDIDDGYPFTNSEKELIRKIRLAHHEDNLNHKVLYKYGLYVNVIAGSLKDIPKKEIIKEFEKLPICTRHDINISGSEIMSLLNKSGGSYIRVIFGEIEDLIIEGKLENKNDKISNYIVENYS